MLTRHLLLAWLKELECDDERSDRQDAPRQGYALAALAERESLIGAGTQEYDHFARTLAQLREDGWLAWDWLRLPPPQHESEPPPARFFTHGELQRCENVRLLPAAHQALGVGGGRATTVTEELAPEQLKLMREMVEASRGVERSQRRFILNRKEEVDVVQGPWGVREVAGDDLEDLERRGFVRARQRWQRGMEVTLEPAAFSAVNQAAQANPLLQVEDNVTRYLNSPAFQAAYPLAYERWREAAALLGSPDAERELTTIGHKAREAAQEFASALVELDAPPDASDNPAHTVQRVRTVLAVHAERLTEARALLEALVAYWGETNDLLQRQVHGGQKEGRPLSWEDGRRVVFHTAITMYELDRHLAAAQRG